MLLSWHEWIDVRMGTCPHCGCKSPRRPDGAFWCENGCDRGWYPLSALLDDSEREWTTYGDGNPVTRVWWPHEV